MKTPVPAPSSPPRGIVRRPFSTAKGDRATTEQMDAIARARARAPYRGRQQIFMRRGRILGTYWVIQDVE